MLYRAELPPHKRNCIIARNWLSTTLSGAVSGDRTRDLLLTKEVPYHLATTAKQGVADLVVRDGFEPSTFGL